MTVIIITDFKGELWRLVWRGEVARYLYKGEAYWKAWWYASPRPHEFRKFYDIPLPIFTEWWST